MRPVLIFSGTKEGNDLAARLSSMGIFCIVSVAEEYGKAEIPDLADVEVWKGRLTEDEMKSLARQKDAAVVIDATAASSGIISKEIRTAVENLRPVSGQAEELAKRLQQKRVSEVYGKKTPLFPGKVLYLRLAVEKKSGGYVPGSSMEEVLSKVKELLGVEMREESPDDAGVGDEDPLDEEILEELRLGGVIPPDDQKDRQERKGKTNDTSKTEGDAKPKKKSEEKEKSKTGGNQKGKASQTGGKSPKQKKKAPSRLETIWEMERRVNSWIPTMLETGKEMPVAEEDRTKNYNRILETYKGHGKPVFPKKRKRNVVDYGSAVYTPQDVYVTGETAEEAPDSGALSGKTGNPGAGLPTNGQERIPEGKENVRIALIGVGMGNPGCLTVEAKKVLDQADYLYGRERLLENISGNQKKLPVFQIDAILNELAGLGEGKVALLFSGDTGFYSDCREVVKSLWNHGYQNLQIYPGISSVSYFSALCGIGWEDAAIINACDHGSVDQWGAEALDQILHREKTFFLMNGASDMRQLGQLLEEQGLENCQIFVGYELSYPQENTFQATAKECRQIAEEGQYVCLVRNDEPGIQRRVVGFPDEAFLPALSAEENRSEEPGSGSWMRKTESAECRGAVLRRLELTEHAVVYDIGSGNGAMAIEIAAQDPSIHVYAMSENPKEIRQIQENCRRERILNVDIIAGAAPDSVDGIEKPSHVLLREGVGNLSEMIQAVYGKNPFARVVILSVSLESIGELSTWEKMYPISDFQVTQMQVNRLIEKGGYHCMEREEAVYLTSFRLGMKKVL